MRYALLFITLSFSMVSCYREVYSLEPDAERFNLQVTAETQSFIYESRDTSYTIEDPELRLFLDDRLLELREIRVRGKSALRFQRKSYTVFLSKPVSIADSRGNGVKELSRFKLLALTMDFTYIENRTGFGLQEKAGVMPLFYKFVEFRINGETQGVYLLIEDPERYYRDIGSEFIIRRGYDHRIDDSDYTPSSYYITPEVYTSRFREIYSLLRTHQGEDLYRELSARLNLDLYFRKIGIDYLLRNGDYTDELFLYSRVEQDTIRYYPVPWDYDDLFNAEPHEVGTPWGPGTVFGKRYYETVEDVSNVVGSKLIFSIEDDLDYTIAQDPYLYAKYVEVLTGLFQELKAADIDEIFAQLEDELSTFYQSEAVIEQSFYDVQPTSQKIWQDNMKEKRAFLLERLAAIQQQLNITP